MNLKYSWLFCRLPQLKLKTYLTVACILLFCTFYWDVITLKLLYRDDKITKFRYRKPFGWQWICDPVSQQCLRESPENASGTTLETCLMTCGPPQIWPIPTGKCSISSTTFPFQFNQLQVKILRSTRKVVTEFLESSIELFKNNIRSLCKDVGNQDDEVKVFVSIVITGTRSDVRYKIYIDESYRLLIKKKGSSVKVSLNALTYLGARHGLETLSQLIWWDENTRSLRITEKATILDNPMYTYRGLLLDTARHYIPVAAIKRTIEAMSMNKLNVFHWHITDRHSFPFYSKNYAQMSLHGAYSDKEIYTTEDIREINRYAEIRGVRVSVEIDTPGRALSGWDMGPEYGNLSLCSHYKPWKEFCDQEPCGHLNPSNPKVYKIMRDLYIEIANITGDPDFIHIGGDGVDYRCWETSKEVTEMEAYKKKGGLGVWEHYEKTLLDHLSMFKKATKNVIVWGNPITKPGRSSTRQKDYIVQAWSNSGQGETEHLLLDNYRVIISHVDRWFLNLKPQWTTVYNHRPWNELETILQKDLIIGGEVCVWTGAMDALALDSRTWPQGAAFAERVWSDPETLSMDSATVRLILQRERILKRGISVGVLGPKWCVQNPDGCL